MCYKAVQFYATESDIKKAMQYAYSLAFNTQIPDEQHTSSDKNKKKQSRTNKTKPLLDENEINEILEKDKEKSQNILEI